MFVNCFEFHQASRGDTHWLVVTTQRVAGENQACDISLLPTLAAFFYHPLLTKLQLYTTTTATEITISVFLVLIFKQFVFMREYIT